MYMLYVTMTDETNYGNTVIFVFESCNH